MYIYIYIYIYIYLIPHKSVYLYLAKCTAMACLHGFMVCHFSIYWKY